MIVEDLVLHVAKILHDHECSRTSSLLAAAVFSAVAATL
jgi:hypothetical protein